MVSAPSSAQDIEWRDDINVAIQEAVKEKKQILLHYTAEWCRPCKQLETFVFSSPLVVNAIKESVIPVKVDVDLHPELVKEFNVTGVPFDVIVTPSGRVVTRRKSPLSADNYIRLVKTRAGSSAVKGDVGKKIAQVQNTFGVEDKDLSEIADRVSSPSDSIQASAHETNFQTKITNQIQRVEQQVVAQSQAPQVATEQSEMRIVNTQQPVASARIHNPYMDRPMKAGASLDMQTAVETTEGAEFVAPELVDNQFETAPVENNSFEPNEFLPQTDLAQSDNDFNVAASTSVEVPTPSTQADAAPAPMVAQPNRLGTGIARIRQDMFEDQSLKIQTEAKIATISPQPIEVPVPGIDQPAKIVAPKLETHSPEAQLAASEFVQQPTDPVQQPVIQQPTARTAPAASAATHAAVAETLAPKFDSSKFALHGKCPVTLMNEGRWVEGNEHWGCVHRGQTYLFSSLKKLATFQSDPDRYSPLLAGFDPVIYRSSGDLVKGQEEHGVFMGRLPEQRVILFNNMETRAQFQANPSIYLETIRQAMMTAEQRMIR